MVSVTERVGASPIYLSPIMSDAATDVSGRLIGQVKWFDATKGYGFITRLDNEDEDVFVHAVDLRPRFGTTDHPVLYTGEYVNFILATSHKKDARDRATEVTGLIGPNGEAGGLLCDYGRIKFKSYARRHMKTP